jgi:Lon protease-like protein
MNDDSNGGALLCRVPLFPLPKVVLLPRAVLPLHIFEERYKQMTADAIEGDRLIAMALLKPGWEMKYYQQAEIETVVCVGRILSHERLADGKYNFLLQGERRARIVREYADRPYRTADLLAFDDSTVLEIDLSAERLRLERFFTSGHLGYSRIGMQFTEILAGPTPTADVIDLVAFNLLEDASLKQSLLAEPDVRRRAEAALLALEAIRPALEALTRPHLARPSLN